MRRDEIFDYSHFKYNQYPVTFRAIYDSDKVQIANTIGFNFDQSPIAETAGNLSYEPEQSGKYSYERSEPYTSRYLVWSGNYYFILPRNFHLSISPGINYGHTDYSYRYKTSADNDGIMNESEEKRLAIKRKCYSIQGNHRPAKCLFTGMVWLDIK